MGVIRRQSLKFTIVNLVGLAIGGASTLLVYPHALQEYGLFQVLLQIGMIGLPLLSLGGNTTAIRYFPSFQEKASGHRGFLTVLLALCFFGTLLAITLLGIFTLFKPDWLMQWSAHSPLLQTYYWAGGPLAVFYTLSAVLNLYSTNFKRIVVPSLLIDFSQKIALPLLLIAVWQQWITLHTAVIALVIYSGTVVLGLIIYLNFLGEWYLKRPDWNKLQPGLPKEMARFIAFGVLGGLALQVAARIDILMVGSLATLKDTGIYAIASYIAATVEIPIRGLYAASASTMTRHLADSNFVELKSLYKKVSINLLIAGSLLFGSIWVSIDHLYYILPNGQVIAGGKMVLLFIGLSRVVEMSCGLNNYMIYYSKYYLYSIISLPVFAALNVGMNFWLIPIYGVTGSAIATLASISGYNLFALLFVWVKFKMQPFSRATLGGIFSALLAYALVQLVPHSSWRLLDMVTHSGAYVLLFTTAVLALRLSPDLNELVGKWRSGKLY